LQSLIDFLTGSKKISKMTLGARVSRDVARSLKSKKQCYSYS